MPSERTIALAGHNVISLEQARAIERGVASVLEAMQARELLGPDGSETWTFLTPLAPGSDYVLSAAILDWLQEQPGLREAGRYRLVVVQAVPLPRLVSAWREQDGLERRTPDGVREETRRDSKQGSDSGDQAVIALLHTFVERQASVEAFDDMHPTGAEGALASQDTDALRAGLARNDAYLLDHANELIVAIDPKRHGLSVPGATLDASVLAQANAAPFSTLSLARRWLDTMETRQLHWIDLSKPSS